MKKITVILSIISMFLIISCKTQSNLESITLDKTESDRKSDILNGKVKYFEEKFYLAIEFDDGEIQKYDLLTTTLIAYNKDGNYLRIIEDTSVAEYKYDSLGNKIESNYYDKSGKLEKKAYWKYNSKNQYIERKDFTPEGSLISKLVRKYNSKGMLIESIYYDSIEQFDKNEVLKYSSKGNVVEVESRDKNGKLIDKFINELSSDGRMKKIIKYDSVGKIYAKHTFTYKKGLLKEIKSYDEKGKRIWKSEVRNDREGNYVQIIYRDREGRTIYVTERKIVYYGDADENNYPQWDTISFMSNEEENSNLDYQFKKATTIIPFLEENKLKEGVITTASGLQYKVIRQGTGKTPKLNDIVKLHYQLKLTDGKVIGNTNEPGRNPITMKISPNSILPGLLEGFLLMKEGGKYLLWIHPELGYEDADSPVIPAGSVLCLEVELIEIKN